MEEIVILDNGFDMNDATIYGDCCTTSTAPTD